MKPTPSSRATLLLAGSCLLVGGIIVWEALTISDIVIQPPPEPRIETVPPSPRDFHLPPIDQYQNFVAHPLFIQGRAPLPDSGKGEDIPAPSDLPKLVLTGILDTPDAGQIVLLRSQDGKRHYRLHPGDAIEGWRLVTIASDHVVLEQGGKRQTLQLLKPRPNPPVTPKRRKSLRPSIRRKNPFIKKNSNRKSL